MNSTIYTVIQASRPKFIILAPVCVFLGIAAADSTNSQISTALTVCCLLIGLFGHISVNLLNEYQDAKSGLDEHTKRTPFSGGSGALQQHPNALNAVRWAGMISLLIVMLLGAYIVMQVNVALSALGLLGIAVVLSYTPWLNTKPWLCLLAPGIGFGLLMIMGTYSALTGTINTQILWLCVPVFCLVNNLLLINQYPDAVADKSVGRQHFVIRFGYRLSALAYLIFVVIAYSAIVLMVLTNMLPKISLLALIALPIGLLIALEAQKFEPSRADLLLPFMGLNVMVTLAVPLILAMSLFFN